eukprot:TRINITY_DN290_c0_g6_i1.p1 TRINITY_DN290_c0_g6~~TRINITY_DN290_c0_g6_i1.p1  ORF type:complete len:554 (+),score=86.38 TRINITY_DN290_c0_g6_i1:67-1728(+)
MRSSEEPGGCGGPLLALWLSGVHDAGARRPRLGVAALLRVASRPPRKGDLVIRADGAGQSFPDGTSWPPGVICRVCATDGGGGLLLQQTGSATPKPWMLLTGFWVPLPAAAAVLEGQQEDHAQRARILEWRRQCRAPRRSKTERPFRPSIPPDSHVDPSGDDFCDADRALAEALADAVLDKLARSPRAPAAGEAASEASVQLPMMFTTPSQPQQLVMFAVPVQPQPPQQPPHARPVPAQTAPMMAQPVAQTPVALPAPPLLRAVTLPDYWQQPVRLPCTPAGARPDTLGRPQATGSQSLGLGSLSPGNSLSTTATPRSAAMPLSSQRRSQASYSSSSGSSAGQSRAPSRCSWTSIGPIHTPVAQGDHVRQPAADSRSAQSSSGTAPALGTTATPAPPAQEGRQRKAAPAKKKRTPKAHAFPSWPRNLLPSDASKLLNDPPGPASWTREQHFWARHASIVRDHLAADFSGALSLRCAVLHDHYVDSELITTVFLFVTNRWDMRHKRHFASIFSKTLPQREKETLTRGRTHVIVLDDEDMPRLARNLKSQAIKPG